MTEAKLRVLICTAAMLLVSACGGHPKKTVPNDEGTGPMSEEDEAALVGEQAPDSAEQPLPDAGPAPAP